MPALHWGSSCSKKHSIRLCRMPTFSQRSLTVHCRRLEIAERVQRARFPLSLPKSFGSDTASGASGTLKHLFVLPVGVSRVPLCREFELYSSQPQTLEAQTISPSRLETHGFGCFDFAVSSQLSKALRFESTFESVVGLDFSNCCRSRKQPPAEFKSRSLTLSLRCCSCYLRRKLGRSCCRTPLRAAN